jgi:DNA polymerase IV
MIRSIIHLDLDAFYASVEQHDEPQLRGLPVLVGGRSGRGVVCACSYEARRYGIHSAMPMAKALRLCPAAVVRPVRMDRYRDFSRRVFAIFARFTDRIEPLSLDEAFLDVSGCERLFGTPAQIAAQIRTAVRQETGLTISAGVARNKFLAKLASDHEKPDGLYVVPDPPESFLLPLPLKRLWGVGPVTCLRLEKLGLRTVADLRQLSEARLEQLFASAGRQLYRLARGEDSRPVVVGSAAHSIGHEDTFDHDQQDPLELHRSLLDLAERVATRLRSKSLLGSVVQLKVRYEDFSTVTRRRTVEPPLDSALAILQVAEDLLLRTDAGQRPVRLLGISLSQLQEGHEVQGELFGVEQRNRLSALDGAVDQLRLRYGAKGVQRASLMPGFRDESAPKTGGDGGDSS